MVVPFPILSWESTAYLTNPPPPHYHTGRSGIGGKMMQLNKQKTWIFKNHSLLGQNSSMFINIIIKSIVKSIAYLSFRYQYRWCWYFRCGIQPYYSIKKSYTDFHKLLILMWWTKLLILIQKEYSKYIYITTLYLR